MVGSTNPARRAARRMGATLAAAWLLATAACGGTVVVDSPGSGGAKSTATGTGGVTTSSVFAASSGDTGIAVTATSVGVTTSSSSGGACNPACGSPFVCCGGTCAETDNDLLNCGGCGIVCPGQHPYCHKGVCEPEPTCDGAPPCPSTGFCCGKTCCSPGQICCDTYGGPVQFNPHCEMPENGTCQKSCFICN